MHLPLPEHEQSGFRAVAWSSGFTGHCILAVMILPNHPVYVEGVQGCDLQPWVCKLGDFDPMQSSCVCARLCRHADLLSEWRVWTGM